MKIKFWRKDNGPRSMLAEAEIILDGDLDGLKIVGFGIWKGKEDGAYVTFPSRSYEKDGERKFFDYVRPVAKGFATTDALKKTILSAYYEEFGGGPGGEPDGDPF